MTATLTDLPRVTPLKRPETPERTSDQFDREAETVIFAIARYKRELEAAQQDRNRLHDLNADARASIAHLESSLREKNDELTRQKALTDAWQHEAARLQAAIEIARAALGQVVGREPEGTPSKG